MKSSHSLVLASAITGCAVALGSYLMWDGGPENRQQQSPGVAKHPTVGDTRQDWRRTTEARHRRPETTVSRTRSRSDTATPRTIPAASALRVTGQPPQGEVSEAEWFARAAKVEQEANREVYRLTQMVGLNAAQQAEVFGVFARNSSSWLPGMQAGGGVDQPAAGSGVSEADQVMAYLNADQQQTLIQEEMDRQAWWEEVLPQLLPPDFPTTTDPGATVPADEIIPFDGAETLLE